MEAAASLAAASFALNLARRPAASRLLGTPESGLSDAVAVPEPRARLVASAVTWMAARLPWHPSCLPQAIATRWMLRRRGIACQAHLGVVSTDPFAAHAWVTVGGSVVQGGPVAGATEIARLG